VTDCKSLSGCAGTPVLDTALILAAAMGIRVFCSNAHLCYLCYLLFKFPLLTSVRVKVGGAIRACAS
jgi:hypothetical protein